MHKHACVLTMYAFVPTLDTYTTETNPVYHEFLKTEIKLQFGMNDRRCGHIISISIGKHYENQTTTWLG